MNRFLTLFLAFSFGLSVKAQTGPVLDLGNDIVLCEPGIVQFQLTAALLSTNVYSQQTIPYNPSPFGGGTPTSLSIDDTHSGIVPIGFPFSFYGNTYTDCIVSANGYISFETSQAGGFSPWVTTTIPSTAGFGTTPTNAIMGPWADFNPNAAGPAGTLNDINYTTVGTAPTRIFIVSFNKVAYFGGACGTFQFTGQIKLYETTNIIETHIEQYAPCTGWNSGNATHGLHNATGTAATVVPGRNNTNFTITNEGYQFNPGGVNWTNLSGTGSTIGSPDSSYVSNGNIVLNFTSDTIYQTTVFVASATVNGTTYTDTITIWMADLETYAIENSCPGANDGTIVFETLDVTPWTLFVVDENDSIFYSNRPIQGLDTVTGFPPGTYYISVLDTLGCQVDDTVVVGEKADVQAIIAPVTDAYLDSAWVSFVNQSVNGASYVWDFGNGQTSTSENPAHFFDSCGTHRVYLLAISPEGCEDTTSVSFDIECSPDEGDLEIPNTFTPNNDGVNDYFNVVLSGTNNLADFSGVIFNRWGAEVYKWTDWQTKENGWNGEVSGSAAAEGTYFYIIRARAMDGEQFEYKGTVTLFR